MTLKTRNITAGVSLLLGILIIVSFSLDANWIYSIDSIQSNLYGFTATHQWVEQFFTFFTTLGNGTNVFFLLLGLLVLTIFTRYRRYGIALVLFVASSAILNDVIKNIFVRERPTLTHLVSAPGYSFPSGHAMNGVVLYGFIAYILYRELNNLKLKTCVSVAFPSIILLIAFSRVALGVHYVSDVITGLLLGYSLLVLLETLFEKIETSVVNKKRVKGM